MKRLIVIAFMALLPSMGAQDQVIKGLRRNATACSPPTMTSRWSVDSSTSTGCSGACTDGAQMASIVDAAGSNTGNQPTAGARPIYKTNQINGLPAAQFTYASHQFWGTTSFGPSGETP